MIRNNQNRRRRGGNNGPRPQQMNGGGNYGNRLDNRQRGNASQLLEKYRALARDAQQAGDRVTAEYYLQYADHYYRVLGDYRDKTPEPNRARGGDFYDDDSAGYAGNSEGGDDDGDDDRSDTRADDRNDDRRDEPRRDEPRGETRGDDSRGNWQGDRAPRDRNNNANRDTANRDSGARESASRDGGQREPRRDGDASRDRQPWNGNANRNRDAAPEADRNRDVRRERPDRAERRPEAPRPAFDAGAAGEGPIPGLPGPATLRVSRPAEPVAEVERPRRSPRRELPLAETPAPEAPILESGVEIAAEPAATTEDAAPRRRGRPRKVVAALPTEG